MKKHFLYLLLSLPIWVSGQYVNLRMGQIPFSNSMWNTWKTASKNADTSQYLLDMLGNKTKMRVVLSNSGITFSNAPGATYSGTAFDQLIPYLTTYGSYYPDTIVLEGIYQSAGWTATVIGLDSLTSYSVTFFGSRDRIDGQGDKFTYGKVTDTLNVDTNSRRIAVFNGLLPTAGQLSFTIASLSSFSYLNALQVVGTPYVSAAVAKIGIDSTVINYPNSFVHMTGIKSTGVLDSAYSWSQVSGPSPAIFTSQGDSMVMSGLRPGTYKFRLMVNDSAFISDSSFVSVTVNGAPACPICAVCPVCPAPVVCPVCPICPAPRTVKGVSKDEITGIITITFSDGTTQTIVTQ